MEAEKEQLVREEGNSERGIKKVTWERCLKKKQEQVACK